MLIAVGGMVLLALGGAGAYAAHQNAADAQRRIAEEDASARRVADEKARRERLLKAQQAKIDSLKAQLPAADDEKKRLAIQIQLDEAQSDFNALLTGDRARRPIYPTSVAPFRCAPGDVNCDGF